MPRKPGEKYLKAKKQRADKVYNRGRPSRSVLYHTSRWKKLSIQFREEHPLCAMCEAQGRVTQADLVDHIVEVSDGGDMWDWDNLQSLCRACHNKKTEEERKKRR